VRRERRRFQWVQGPPGNRSSHKIDLEQEQKELKKPLHMIGRAAISDYMPCKTGDEYLEAVLSRQIDDLELPLEPPYGVGLSRRSEAGGEGRPNPRCQDLEIERARSQDLVGRGYCAL
jgi:hypothetical protein